MNEILRTVEENIRHLSADKPRVILALDGRCGAGKTTVAKALARRCRCLVLHMDDFFLPPELRVQERLAVPGENVHHERFLAEVLSPVSQGVPFVYRPFDCGKADFGEPVSVDPSAYSVIVVEGSYACHPALWDRYDLRVFLDVSPERQAERILARNGPTAARRFADLWIPLEEAYFDAYDLRRRCDIYLTTDSEQS